VLNRKQFQRYSRQIMLPQVGEAGQEKLSAARVMIVGLGGLGSPVALYLAAAGVGEIHLVDGDQIDLSNLQRQILYKTNHITKSKAQTAAQQLTAANPEIRLHAHMRMADEAWLRDQLPKVDLVLDCSDNLDIRYTLNRVCREAGLPVIMASARGLFGQLISFDFCSESSPCYACLFPPHDQQPVENCSSAGVLGPVLGIVGSMQALEAIKWILGLPVTSESRLQLFEAETLEWRQLQLSPVRNCPVCAGK
jgi:sulfur carrier protein ThiS adenylyltransferase